MLSQLSVRAECVVARCALFFVSQFAGPPSPCMLKTLRKRFAACPSIRCLSVGIQSLNLDGVEFYTLGSK
jgi:hypothetical protein